MPVVFVMLAQRSTWLICAQLREPLAIRNDENFWIALESRYCRVCGCYIAKPARKTDLLFGGDLLIAEEHDSPTQKRGAYVSNRLLFKFVGEVDTEDLSARIATEWPYIDPGGLLICGKCQFISFLSCKSSGWSTMDLSVNIALVA